jgi:hypothetical protein
MGVELRPARALKAVRNQTAGYSADCYSRCSSSPRVLGAFGGGYRRHASPRTLPETHGKIGKTLKTNGGDDGARTRDLRRDRPKASKRVNRISFYFQFVARIVKHHFSSCYSTCYSSAEALWACTRLVTESSTCRDRSHNPEICSRQVPAFYRTASSESHLLKQRSFPL